MSSFVCKLCSRTSNNIPYKVHVQALKEALNDHTRDFKTLLQRNNNMCNHRNIQTPLIDIFKLKNGLAPPIMGSMFKWGNMTYNLRKF